MSASNILVFGATGRTGREIVKQGLELYHVTAFARDPADLTLEHPHLRVVRGDILDYESVEAAVKGQDAVLVALGKRFPRKLFDATTLTDGTRNIVRAMEAQGVTRLICETSLEVGDSEGQLGWFFRYFVIPFFLRRAFRDKETQEQVIRQSSLAWVIVRPGVLSNGPRTGDYHAGFSNPAVHMTARISRADVADFMLKQVESDTFLRRTPGLSY